MSQLRQTSQILALGTNPVTIIPAPGVNKFNIIEKIVLKYNYGSTQYIEYSDYGTYISFGPDENSEFTYASSVIENSEDMIQIIPLGGKGQFLETPANALNKSIIAAYYTDGPNNMTGGDGDVDYQIWYQTISI